MDIEERVRKFFRRMSRGDRSLVFTRFIFLRFLALISFGAFLSFYLQMPGLVGSSGILPAHQLIQAAADAGVGFLQLPTLAWISASDTALAAISMGGMVFSILLFVDLFPRLNIFLTWMCYLSLVSVGQVFMSYQWDILLLETLFLSLFIAPSDILPSRIVEPPSRLSAWAMRILLFKLMFLSGISKILSGDPAWQDLSALSYHYLTQPLPMPPAWLFDKLPLVVHQASTAATLVIEIAVPFLVFADRKWRGRAGVVIIGFQLLIMLTGNYTMFNLLAIALALFLLDDWYFTRIRGWMPFQILRGARLRKQTSFERFAVLVLSLVLLLNVLVFLQFLGAGVASSPVSGLMQVNSNFHVSNTYGLFAVMTTQRNEIMIQGSMNGNDWENYTFIYKPGELHQAPPVVAPHQPRLDWQMWFAALRDSPPRWFYIFSHRLLEGSEEVENLLANDPFGDRSPRYVRAIIYEYEFSDWEGLREGRWWKRSDRRIYMQPIRLRN